MSNRLNKISKLRSGSNLFYEHTCGECSFFRDAASPIDRRKTGRQNEPCAIVIGEHIADFVACPKFLKKKNEMDALNRHLESQFKPAKVSKATPYVFSGIAKSVVVSGYGHGGYHGGD